jgi:AraC-like DNA-binding protein
MDGTHRHGEGRPNPVDPPVDRAAGVSAVEFLSRDQDETRAFLRSNYGENSRVIYGTGSFLYRISALDTGRVIVGRTRRQLQQTLRAAVRHPTLFLTLDEEETLTYGRNQYRLQPDRAVFSAAGHDYTRRGGDVSGFAVRVDSTLFESELAARLPGRFRRWLAPSCPVPITPARWAELLSFEATMRTAAGPGRTWGSYGDVRSFEQAVAGWLAELVIGVAGVRSINEPGLERLARVERWIDANLDQDITLDRLCAVAGASARSLQKAFLASRGQTPYEFLTARRLAEARRRLESATPRLRVSAVALDCGFRHLGRFSASYRAAYGELPGETAGSVKPRRPTSEDPPIGAWQSR